MEFEIAGKAYKFRVEIRDSRLAKMYEKDPEAFRDYLQRAMNSTVGDFYIMAFEPHSVPAIEEINRNALQRKRKLAKEIQESKTPETN
jgi:hypothetical protein